MRIVGSGCWGVCQHHLIVIAVESNQICLRGWAGGSSSN